MGVTVDGVRYLNLDEVATVLEIGYDWVTELTRGSNPRLPTKTGIVPGGVGQHGRKFVALHDLEKYILERYDI